MGEGDVFLSNRRAREAGGGKKKDRKQQEETSDMSERNLGWLHQEGNASDSPGEDSLHKCMWH